MWKSKFLLMSVAAVLGSALIGLMLSNSSNATNPESVVVQVAFVAPISVSAETSPLEFGSLDVAMLLNDTVTVNPDGTSAESAANIVGGTQDSASLDVIATPGRPINILVDNVTAGAHYTLGTWLCDYNAGAANACFTPGWSTTSIGGTIVVRVGATLTGLGTAVAGDFDGSFDLTVAYE